ncbi:hypothetical protein lerEdw1_019973 [Lerista edwardsae]|nr:hypothetical protein lerEdw1_019973 [Lerista edwardsae]
MPRERRRRAAEGARPQERAPRGPARKERAGARRELLGCASALALAGLLLGLGLRARWGPTSLLTAPHPAGRALGANSSGAAAAPGLFWGSYRPQVYLGMKTRSPRSPVAGLMWLQPLEGDVRLRHTCEQSDGLPRYGWLLHDGVHFGVQEIRDVGLSLQTEFVKRPGGQHGGDWSWRVTARPEVGGLGNRRGFLARMLVPAAFLPFRGLPAAFHPGAASQLPRPLLRRHHKAVSGQGNPLVGAHSSPGGSSGVARTPESRSGEAPFARQGRPLPRAACDCACRSSWASKGSAPPRGLEDTLGLRPEAPLQAGEGRGLLSGPLGGVPNLPFLLQRAGVQTPLVSLLFYVATDGQGTLQPLVEEKSRRLLSLTGTTEELGHFTITFQQPTTEAGAAPLYASYNYLQAEAEGLHRITDVVRASLTPRFVHAPPGAPKRRYFGVDTYRRSPGPDEPRSQLLVHQVTVALPCRLEVAFESGSVTERPGRLLGEVLTRELGRHVAAFEQRFEQTFGLARKGYSPQEQHFARAALSNLLGGAVPSRSFFPRGFLWDEGFHQLLLGRWDPALSREVLAHWLDLMNAEGWIPREQILGEEARAKLLTQGAAETDFLRRLYPRLQSWYDWYNRTQAGPLPYSFRWRGRDQDTQLFLNPKTLTSGLDDYPRASHPSPDERHLDLRCWMAVASAVMAEVLADNELLDQQHWAKALGSFADYGNHTQAVSLERERLQPPPPGQPPPVPRLLRVVRQPPRLQFVGGALGYVSLFPLLLQLLRPDSPRLGSLLADMRSEAKLWTPFGLRSLSRTSPFYLRRNTEHDPPYWRGPIWINMNFLAVRALHHYGQLEGPHREQAAALYQELRANVVRNVFRQYVESGYLWEQYHDGSGKGQGCYPFTGWSALVVLMMAEEY